MVQHKHIILLALFLVLISISQVNAVTYADCNGDICASITVPDSVAPNTDFEISIEGSKPNATGFDFFSFILLENTQQGHSASNTYNTSGYEVDGNPFFSGASFERSYIMNKPSGSYTYTFIFGVRDGWDPNKSYDVVVEAKINTATQETRVVAFDIKPGSCRNPFNIKSKGVIPAAILGSDDFDVRTVENVMIAGVVTPVQYAYEDIAQPFDPSVAISENDGCPQASPDGYLDLVLKFKSEDIHKALAETQGGALARGDVIKVKMTAEAQNQDDSMGTQTIEGEDVIQVITKNWQLRL